MGLYALEVGARAGNRPGVRRLPHRCDLVEMRVLYQHSHRIASTVPAEPVFGRSALHTKCQAWKAGWSRARLAQLVGRVHAIRPGPGSGRRLVWQHGDSLGLRGPGPRAGRFPGMGVHARQADDQPSRCMANRNLALGCTFIFVLGAAIYSLTTLLPVFYQTLMGYNATAAGLAVSPRGLGSTCELPFSSVCWLQKWMRGCLLQRDLKCSRFPRCGSAF